MAQNKFGGPIDKPAADVLFKRYIDIKKRSLEKIRQALTGDTEAIRFYCGREGAGFNDDLAYIFDQETLIPVITRILANKADGFVLFNGARSQEDADSTGRPTLILFPYKLTKQFINEQEQDVIVNLLTDGEEHPGTGGSSDPGGDGLPGMFLPGDFHLLF